MGYALMEQVVIDAGKVLTTNFGENKIPSIHDIPMLKTVVQEFAVGNGPYGGMSIGEPPVVPVAAAIANAVHDAVGVRIYDLPITAEKVLTGAARRNSRVFGRDGVQWAMGRCLEPFASLCSRRQDRKRQRLNASERLELLLGSHPLPRSG